MMFKSTTRATQDKHEDRLLHEKKTASNWDNVKGGGDGREDRSQTRRKLQPELRILDNDMLSLKGEAGVGDMVMEHKPRIALMIAELHASGYNRTESKKYHWLLVYNDESFDTDEGPLLGWIVAATPQTASVGTVGLQGRFDYHHARPYTGPSND